MTSSEDSISTKQPSSLIRTPISRTSTKRPIHTATHTITGVIHMAAVVMLTLEQFTSLGSIVVRRRKPCTSWPRIGKSSLLCLNFLSIWAPDSTILRSKDWKTGTKRQRSSCSRRFSKQVWINSFTQGWSGSSLRKLRISVQSICWWRILLNSRTCFPIMRWF